LCYNNLSSKLGVVMVLKKYGVIIFISFMSLLYILLSPKFYLLGDSEINIDVFDEYKEVGYSGTCLFKAISSKVIIDSNINTSKIGKYNITYTLKCYGFNITKKRTINVVDKEAPVIKLNGEIESVVCPLKQYEEKGYEVVDNYDSNLNEKVVIKTNENSITYSVSDSSGNVGIAHRKIKYEDIESPTINLVGSTNMNIYVGSSYNEPGYTALDNCDGDISSKVIVSGSVNTNNIGSYDLIYSVTDNSGKTTSVIRKVNVIENRKVVSGVGKKIYLTFDDGPSNTITPGVLQILREEGIKATFFVINKSDSLNYLIRQAYDEGHTIALHSSTHNYSYIYSSVDNYFADLNTISDKVQRITGVKSMIIRFPGGSSNTASKKYQIGIMSTLTQMVLDRGYSYFDWNVDSGDAGGSRTQYDVYYKVTNNLVYQNNVVLLHDFENNYKTLNALRDIIKYGKKQGYTFHAITNSTTPSRHRVNN